MNHGIKTLYEQILINDREIKTCLIGSYELNGYMDMQHVYLDWEKYKESYVITIRQDRFAINMRKGENVFEDYKL